MWSEVSARVDGFTSYAFANDDTTVNPFDPAAVQAFLTLSPYDVAQQLPYNPDLPMWGNRDPAQRACTWWMFSGLL